MNKLLIRWKILKRMNKIIRIRSKMLTLTQDILDNRECIDNDTLKKMSRNILDAEKVMQDVYNDLSAIENNLSK